MNQKNLQRTNLLEYFYEYLAESDWLSGVDLYQSGKITEARYFDGLITGKVSSFEGGSVDIHVKLRPGGGYIQWIECSCKKNRKLNAYCEHIAAFFIYLDREKSDWLKTLDKKMPLKPPFPPKKTWKAEGSINEQQAAVDGLKGKGALQTLFDHLKQSIHSLSFLASGPTLRVRLEIKPGVLTHYDLDIDSAARFLRDNKSLAEKLMTGQQIHGVKVFDVPVEIGTRIFLNGPEEIFAEKSLAIRTLSLGEKILSEAEPSSGCRKISLDMPSGEGVFCQFLPLKSGNKFVGKEFLFVPGHGYWPIKKVNLSDKWPDLPFSRSFVGDEAANFLDRKFSDYLSAGPVFVDQDLQDLLVFDKANIANIAVHSAVDNWFFLAPQYQIGDEMVSMVTLAKHFKKKTRQYLRVKKGWLKIPDFITEFDWTMDQEEKYFSVDKLGLLRLKAAVGDFDHFIGSKTALNKLRSDLEFKPESAPPSLTHTKLQLRPYQTVGFSWLWWLRNNGLHGLLADEMGLGKTHEAMALFSAIQKENKDFKFLVICPTTVLEHWEDKINDFAPQLKPLKYHGSKRREEMESIKVVGRTIITSYGVVLRDVKMLNEVSWDVVILDEAHFIKNNITSTHQAACQLNCKMRVCLTGTPMENHLGELKNLFDFLVPGFLGSDSYFKKHFIKPIIQDKNLEAELTLQKMLHPFKMRRIKEEVLADLPLKVEDYRFCQLSDEQAALYRQVLELKARPLVDKLKDETSQVSYLHVFAVLTLLKQICDHPLLIGKEEGAAGHDVTGQSGKFELLKELLDEALGSNHKVVIFSQYVKMIELIDQYLSEQQVAHVVLTGQSRNRGEIIARFQTDPSCRVFCGSLLAGGIGIDLTAASVVIHYDRWWNASKENQATDRVHRIGQNKNVQVLKLLAKGTMEEKIDRLIKQKQELFQKFLDQDEELFNNLSRKDLIDLLEG